MAGLGVGDVGEGACGVNRGARRRGGVHEGVAVGSVWMPAMVPSIWPVLRLTLVMVADWPGTVCGAVFTGSIGTTTVMSTVPLLPSSAVMMMVVVWGAPGVAALWRVWGWGPGEGVGVGGVEVDAGVEAGEGDGVAVGVGHDVREPGDDDCAGDRVSCTDRQGCGIDDRGLIGWHRGVFGDVDCDGAVVGFCPVSRPSRLARPWTWGPLSGDGDRRWSAAVLPGLAT